MGTTIEYQRVAYVDAQGTPRVCGHTHTSQESVGTCARMVVRKLMREAFPGFPRLLQVGIQDAKVTES